MEAFFQLQHVEINKNVLKIVKDACAVLKLRITHVMDCEAYIWHKKFFYAKFLYYVDQQI